MHRNIRGCPLDERMNKNCVTATIIQQRQLSRPKFNEYSYQDETGADSSPNIPSLAGMWTNQLPRSNTGGGTWIVENKDAQASIVQMTRNTLDDPIDVDLDSGLISFSNMRPPPKVYL